MTLSEKIKQSHIIYCEREKASKYGIKNSKKRFIGFVIFIIMALFTIFSKIINKSDKDNLTAKLLDYSIICIIANLFLTFILKFMKKSVFALNYNKTYRLFKLLWHTSKVFVFFFTMVAYINKVLDYWDPYVELYALKNSYAFHAVTLSDKIITRDFIVVDEHNVYNMSFVKEFLCKQKISNLVTFVLCAFTILTFIPTFLYFLIIFIKTMLVFALLYFALIPALLIFLIPVLNLVLVIRILTRPIPTFKYCHYDEKDKNYVIVEKRKIDGINNKVKWFGLNLIKFLPLVIITLGSYVLLIAGAYISHKYSLGLNVGKIIEIMADNIRALT